MARGIQSPVVASGLGGCAPGGASASPIFVRLAGARAAGVLGPKTCHNVASSRVRAPVVVQAGMGREARLLDPLERAVSIASTRLRKKDIQMSQGIVSLTSGTFDETVLGADKPVVVDFWAEWCGPCKMIAPILEEIAGEQTGKLAVAKLNVDEHPDLARRYDVMSIPTLLVFNKGVLAKRMVGAKGKGQLLQELQEFLDTPSH